MGAGRHPIAPMEKPAPVPVPLDRRSDESGAVHRDVSAARRLRNFLRRAIVPAAGGNGNMARKLKTYQTSLGFFDLAIAAPSMKAALEAWGAGSNLFHQGIAKE